MSDNSLSNKRIAKNSIFLTIRMVIVLGISLYITRAVLKVLGVEDYGVYNVVCGFVSLFAFLNTSMSNGVQRFFNYEYGKNGVQGANKVYCTSLFIQFILALIVLVLTESVGIWYLHNKMVIPDGRTLAAEWIFQFSIVSFLFIIMQAPYTAAVIAHERLDFYAVVSVLDVLLKLGIVFLLPLFSIDKLVIYGLLLSLISVINFLVYFVYCKIHFQEIVFHRHFDKPLFKSMLGFSGWNLFGAFSGVMQTQGNNLVINYFFGPVVNAAKGIATQVNGAMQGFVSNLTMPVRPQVVQSYAKGDVQRTMNLTFSISKLSCCVLLMMAIPFSLESNFVLRLWLGNNVPNHTAAFTIIILLDTLAGNLNAATSNVIHATGNMKDYQLWGSLIKISSVPISFYLMIVKAIPELALLTMLFCGIVAHIVGLFIVRKVAGLSLREYFMKVIVPITIVLFVSLMVSIPFRILMHEGLVRLLLVTIVGVSSVALSLYFIALNINEKRIVVSGLHSFLAKVNLVK